MKQELGLLRADADRFSRDIVDTSLKYKRLDGVPAALKTLRDPMLDGDTQRISLREELIGAKVPVQVIWGTIPASQAQGLPPSIAVQLLPNVGYRPMVQAAADMTKLIADEHVLLNRG